MLWRLETEELTSWRKTPGKSTTDCPSSHKCELSVSEGIKESGLDAWDFLISGEGGLGGGCSSEIDVGAATITDIEGIYLASDASCPNPNAERCYGDEAGKACGCTNGMSCREEGAAGPYCAFDDLNTEDQGRCPRAGKHFYLRGLCLPGGLCGTGGLCSDSVGLNYVTGPKCVNNTDRTFSSNPTAQDNIAIDSRPSTTGCSDWANACPSPTHFQCHRVSNVDTCYDSRNCTTANMQMSCDGVSCYPALSFWVP